MRRRWLVIGGGGLVALAVLVALIVFVAELVGEGSDSHQAKNKEYTVGESASLSDRALTVNEVQRGFVPSSTERPPQGYEFVRVNITLVNTSSSAIDINPLVDFSVEDPNGLPRSVEAIQEVPDELNNPTALAADGTLTGNLVSEVPQGTTNLKLIYKPHSFTGDMITVDL
jgi:hypothetical protein